MSESDKVALMDPQARACLQYNLNLWGDRYARKQRKVTMSFNTEREVCNEVTERDTAEVESAERAI